MNIVLQRKRDVAALLQEIENYPATSKFKQEMMSFAYVLACGAIEFMIETILLEWLDKTKKYHKNCSYRGKKYIEYFLNVQLQKRQEDIEKFTSTKLSNIKGLVGEIVGEQTKDKFDKLLLKTSVITQSDVASRLDRITQIRHDLAHGQKIPQDLQPNITELKQDFYFVYEHIIKNIKKSLPRV